VPTSMVIESRIDGEFEGWTGETIFPLQNGQYWLQAVYAYFYRYAYAPSVRIVRDAGSRYQLHVDGVSNSVAVERVEPVVDSFVISEFDGWDGETIVELANGQVWQQSGPAVAVGVAVRPRAVIYSAGGFSKMWVAGFSSNAPVERLR
jgi:hypothetical protein